MKLLTVFCLQALIIKPHDGLIPGLYCIYKHKVSVVPLCAMYKQCEIIRHYEFIMQKLMPTAEYGSCKQDYSHEGSVAHIDR